MKKANIFLSVTVCIFLAFAVFVTSCQDKKEEKPNVLPDGVSAKDIVLGPETSNSSLKIESEITLENGLVLPVGTVFSKDPNDRSSLIYTLPEGYKLAGKNARSEYTFPANGTVTCSCTEGGCSPFISTIGGKTTSGCLLSGSCKICKKTNSIRVVNPNGARMELSDPEIINFNQSIEFVTDVEAKELTVSPSAAFLDIPEVQKGLQEFAKGFQKANLSDVHNLKDVSKLPEGYVMAAVNVYGKLVFIPVDSEIAVLISNPATNGYVYDPSVSTEKGARTNVYLFLQKLLALVRLAVAANWVRKAFLFRESNFLRRW